MVYGVQGSQLVTPPAVPLEGLLVNDEGRGGKRRNMFSYETHADQTIQSLLNDQGFVQHYKYKIHDLEFITRYLSNIIRIRIMILNLSQVLTGLA